MRHRASKYTKLLSKKKSTPSYQIRKLLLPEYIHIYTEQAAALARQHKSNVTTAASIRTTARKTCHGDGLAPSSGALGMPPRRRRHPPSPPQAAARAAQETLRRLGLAVPPVPEGPAPHRQPAPARPAPARLTRGPRRQAQGAPHAAPPRLRAHARRLLRRRGPRRVPPQRPRHVRPPGALRGRQVLLRPAEHLLRAAGRRVLARRAPRVPVRAPRPPTRARVPRGQGGRGRRARRLRGGRLQNRRCRGPERPSSRHEQQDRATCRLRRRRRRPRWRGGERCPQGDAEASRCFLGGRLRAVAGVAGRAPRPAGATGAELPSARCVLRERHRQPPQKKASILRRCRRRRRRGLGRRAPPPAHVQSRPDQRHPHGHVHRRDRHVGGDGGMDDDGAGKPPGHPGQGAAGGAQRCRRRQGHGPGARPPGPHLPEAGHQGVHEAAPAGAAAGAPGDHRAMHGPRLRDTGRDQGARQLQGHRRAPRHVGRRRVAVRSRTARGRRGRRRRRRLLQDQERQLRARAVRDRAAELPRHALRDGRRGAGAGQPALLL